jgi:hypothetical protein
MSVTWFLSYMALISLSTERRFLNKVVYFLLMCSNALGHHRTSERYQLDLSETRSLADGQDDQPRPCVLPLLEGLMQWGSISRVWHGHSSTANHPHALDWLAALPDPR